MSEVIENVDVEIPEISEVELPVEVSIAEPTKSSIFSKESIMTCFGGTAVTVLCSAIIQTGVNGLVQGGKKLYRFGRKKLAEAKEAKELKKLEESIKSEAEEVAQETESK